MIVFTFIGVVVSIVLAAVAVTCIGAMIWAALHPFDYGYSRLSWWWEKTPHRHKWRKTHHGRQCLRCWEVERHEV